MAVSAYDVLVPGHYFCDVIFSGLPRFPSLGTEIYTKDLNIVAGGVVNTIIGLQRLGIKVGWLGALGNDMFSNFVYNIVRDEGVDLSLLAIQASPLQRLTVALSFPEDRSFVTFVDTEPDIVAMISAAIDNPDIRFQHLHIPELRIDERLPDIIDRCHAENITVSMDCQHVETTIAASLVQTILQKTDIFTPNATELRQLADEDDLMTAAQLLTEWCSYLVVKDGQNGAHLWRDEQYVHATSIPVDNIVDTTGAGDVFNTGFLAAYRRGLSPERCLEWGNAAGGLSLRGPGGYSAAPDLHEISQWVQDS